MRRPVGLTAVVVGIAVLAAVEAEAGNYVLYLHGRSNTTWTRALARVPGWTDVTMTYDGNARLADERVNGRISGAMTTYCSGQNKCVVSCHSAGCMRTLMAVDSLTAAGKKLNLLWVEAGGSAAGGTRLAELSTNLIGDQPIDEDMRRDRARAGTGWAHIQDAMTSSLMYHVAGRRDSCILFICGNWFLPAGTCDGLVCIDSAGGGSRSGEYADACAMPLYPGRIYDSKYSACRGADVNHATVADLASRGVTTGLKQ